ncbi:hypothetical protein PENNAL_c0024G10964 [Penicillium nalgiovense]|uniref:Uncharacterized protein n=1 Tax=Penicillium nalgiovense TaxID=60175 RepID=A0A1V6YDK2_PENNA|nr:hypothetical protein PENNAL_c0024G10964 [Penicillium nalgiovense]
MSRVMHLATGNEGYMNYLYKY